MPERVQDLEFVRAQHELRMEKGHVSMKPDDQYAEAVDEADRTNMRPLLESFHSIQTSPNGSKLRGAAGTEHAIVNFEDTFYRQQRYEAGEEECVDFPI